ncbi:MAG: hypothetical protein IPN75_03495 [Dechloromonas sp.]|uniref:Uncharacterized protein n=1 Tax=Candidatus Dechloromonas phosphorivorans TaxID=2899244 RepID=A0A9D7LP61_9RHOO|nr:hypothetical protein [Candidatus Dechloromonas phosphorivorans]
MKKLLPEAAIKSLEEYSAGLMNRNELYAQFRKQVGNVVFEGTRSCWENMKSRCKNAYAYLCPELESLPDFIRHMGFRPCSDASIHRKDNFQGYTHENIVWADKKTQSRERTNTVVLSLNDVSRPLVAWAEDRGVNPSAMRRRKTLGWSDEEIITGERNITSDPSSTTFWAYTPWPRGFELNWERQYAESRHAGEHRLRFYERFIIERLHRLQDELENLLIYDEDFTGMPSTPPTPAESMALKDNQMKIAEWESCLRDARLKLGRCSGEDKPRFYDVPDWVEEKFDRLIRQANEAEKRKRENYRR